MLEGLIFPPISCVGKGVGLCLYNEQKWAKPAQNSQLDSSLIQHVLSFEEVVKLRGYALKSLGGLQVEKAGKIVSELVDDNTFESKI